MAAPPTPDARGTPPAERFRMLRELGAGVVPAHAALDLRPDGRPETRPLLVVLERVTRGGAYGDAEIADWVRDARRLATLEHPNIARIRDVVVDGDEALVVSEFIDGVRWSDIVSAPRRVSLEIALRVLLDALSGLSAVHNLRDVKREPLKLVHGELTPDCLVLGMDGVARVVSTCHLRSATARPGRDGSAYLAPEVLLADETADARADVYSVGVMLWEALSGQPLFPNTQPSAIVTHLLSGKVVRASIPDGSPWAAPLADVASRALSADPEKRFPSAAALAAELRRIAGPKLAPPVRVAAFVRAMFGDRVQARRAELERGETPEDDIAIPVEEGPESVRASFESSAAPGVSPTAPTPVPPPPEKSPSLSRPARETGKRPAVPALRPRLPTLTGLAPPVSVETAPPVSVEKGTDVVVRHGDAEGVWDRSPPPVLSMPTPYVSFEVPSAARIPATDLADLTDLAETPPAAVGPAGLVETPPAAVVVPMVPAPPATPAPGFGSALDDLQPAARRRRGTLAAWVAGPLILGAAAIVWWLATRPPVPDTTQQTPTATGATLAPLSPPSSELPSPLPGSSAAAGAAPLPTPRSTDHGDSVPADAAFSAPPAPAASTSAGPATAVPPRYPAATGTTPAPAARPPTKRKYEPEGI